MNARVVRTIYAKELVDSLRDRRTLISTILLPVFLMPTLLFTMTTITARVVSTAAKEIPAVMVVGGEDSPGVRAELEKSGRFSVRTATSDWKTLIADKRVRAAVEIPPGFERGLARGSAPAVTLYHFEGELKSGMAVGQLESFFTDLRVRTTTKLLAERGLPASVARPFELKRANIVPPQKTGGNQLGGIVAYFIVMLCIVGAMYPAMDLAAGEKERGTMETLLCSPASRADIVVGKFLMVLTGSLAAVGCSLVSMGLTLSIIGSAMKAQGHGPGVVLDPVGILGLLVMVIPVAVLFSALLFAVSLFAKSYKEAQTYATPIMIAVIVPIVIGILPGIDLDLRLALVPILNISLVCKEMLSGVWHWGYIAVVFGSTALYAGVALALAVRMFKSEEVIFRT
jgi:sodium transport system permease protein